jgi:hypothetical protein
VILKWLFHFKEVQAGFGIENMLATFEESMGYGVNGMQSWFYYFIYYLFFHLWFL